MKSLSRRMRPLLLCGALVAGATSFSPLVKTAHAQSVAKSAESVLKESGLAFTKGENSLRVYVEAEGQTTGVTVLDKGIGVSADLKLIYLYTEVLNIPKGTKAPAGLTKRIALINDNLLVGKLSLQEGAEGSGVFYNSSIWLKTATGETLETEIVLAHYSRLEYAKVLAPYLKGE